ncbi:MAG: hypothetical protein ACXW30_00280 [Micavibrio sp.]
MSFKKLMCAAAAFATVASLGACGTEQPAQPVSVDDVRPKYSQDMQQSLTGYYETHGLDKSIAPAKGLTIAWVASTTGFEINGFMVATGEKSERGCPIFKNATLENVGKRGGRVNSTLAMCP